MTENEKPKREVSVRWWKQQIKMPLLFFLLLSLGAGIGTISLVRPTPNPVIQTIREILNPTPTYIPPNDNRVNTTFVSALTSATPYLSNTPHHTDVIDSATRPCTEQALTDTGKFVFRLWLQRSKELYRIDEDGTNLCHLTRDNFVDDQPAWSPDGQQIAFVSTREGYGIYIMNADGTEKTKLTDGGSAYSFPEWSPDGSQIIFQATIDEQFDLHTIQADGTELRNLTNDPRLDSAPAWSPDGEWIAFASDRTYNPFIPNRLKQSANYDIYLMDAVGLQIHRLTSNDVSDFYPTWSPDSARIAYMSSYSDIFVMNRDGSDARFIAYGRSPVWSTNGQEIAFIQQGSLHKINLTTEEIQQVGDIHTIEHMDYWSPK